METRPPFSKPPVIIKPFEAVPPGIVRPPETKPTSILPLVTILGCVSMLIVAWAIYSAAVVVDPRIFLLVCLLVFWMAGSAGIALSAKTRGRSAVAFFFLSIFFSWFLMALIVACMSKDPR
jgi:hypothetical protein